MRVLLSFENFSGFGGTETYTLTVARELDRLGHDASIYSPHRGEMAELARQEGIPVLGRRELPKSCDLVIASDAATCQELSGRYLDAVLVMVVHSADHMLQAPPQLADRCQAVVVLNERTRRAVEARAWHAPITRLRQPIELTRFCNLGPHRPVARSALVTTNYVAGPRAKMIETACRANGLDVNWIGVTTRSTATPEVEIARADLVIGLGRSAIEAMAAGRAAYVFGIVGGDGWVTPDRYPAMEADGFAGTSAPGVQIDVERMTADLAEWNEHMGERNRDLASAHHSSREHAVALINLARDLTRSAAVPPTLSEELAHLIRLQWRYDVRSAASNAEAARLGVAMSELEQQVELLRARLAEAEARFEALRRTRRYRLASELARPLDRLRRARSMRRARAE